jgi:hypothetical protein
VLTVEAVAEEAAVAAEVPLSFEVTAAVVVVSAYAAVRAEVVSAIVSTVVAAEVVVTASGILKSSSLGAILLRRSVFQIPMPSIIIIQQLRATEALFMYMARFLFFSARYSSLRRKTRSAILL